MTTTKLVTVSETGVRKSIAETPITLDKIGVSGEFQKPGTLTAQIRQRLITVSSYPSKKTSSTMQSNIFSNEEFGFEEQTFESVENRVAFILVPIGITEEIVKARLEAATKNGARIYRVLSNAPVLDENQEYAISAGIRTKDQFAESQVVRYPKNEDNDTKGLSGKIWTDPQGRVQYRRTYFWKTTKEDIDLRNGKSEYYTTPAIEAELNGASVLKGQTI